MTPWGGRWWRKNPSDPWFFEGDIFEEIEAEMARMRQRMNQFIQEALSEHKPSAGTTEPFVYGFTFRVGPDGKPHFQEFGNTRPWAREALEAGREPLTDIQVGPDTVSVTVELPGVEKEDINLHAAEDRLTIRVQAGRRYHKEVRLPVRVVPSSAKATYKNGVLDITLKRAESSEEPGHRVPVE